MPPVLSCKRPIRKSKSSVMSEREVRCYQNYPKIFCKELRSLSISRRKNIRQVYLNRWAELTHWELTYYPDIISTDEEPHYGKYGSIRIEYLKEHRLTIYSTYLLEDCLIVHLNNVDDVAHERMKVLI